MPRELLLLLLLQRKREVVGWRQEVDAVAGVAAVIATATPACLEANGIDVNDGLPVSQMLRQRRPTDDVEIAPGNRDVVAMSKHDCR